MEVIDVSVLKSWTVEAGIEAILSLLEKYSCDTWWKFLQAAFGSKPTFLYKELEIEKIKVVLGEMIPQMKLGRAYSLHPIGFGDLLVVATPQGWYMR